MKSLSTLEAALRCREAVALRAEQMAIREKVYVRNWGGICHRKLQELNVCLSSIIVHERTFHKRPSSGRRNMNLLDDCYPPSFGHSTRKKLESAYEMKQVFSNLQIVAELDCLLEVF